MSLKRRQTSPLQDTSNISTSPMIEDRKSTFIGLYSPSLSVKELQAHAKTEDATHRIVAWRKAGTQRSLKTSQPLLESGHDDDGEKYGGKTVERVMEATGVQGVVVVARWYGGVMLGPVRFDHIRHCAQAAISNWSSMSNEASKKIKVQPESEQKTELEQTLRERDASITVLRDLLAEKKGQSSSQQSSSSSPAKPPDYEKLPLHVLKRLEEVRDATIGWILKGIEEAEKKGDGNENSKS